MSKENSSFAISIYAAGVTGRTLTRLREDVWEEVGYRDEMEGLICPIGVVPCCCRWA